MRTSRLLHQFTQRIDVNDFILAALLFYLCADMRRNWEAFSSCGQPVCYWLLGTYAFIALMRVAHLAGSAPTFYEIDGLLPHGSLGHLTWPLLVAWTVAGSLWTWSGRAQSKFCLAEPRHFFLVVSLIVASWTWLIFYAWVSFMAGQRKQHIDRMKYNIRAVEDDDMRLRWGNMSEMPQEVALGRLSQGLTAAEIAALSSKIVPASATTRGQNADCPICLCALRPGDSVRPLGACGHTFHRACIDLWLLRRAECPLCKASVGDQCNWSV